MRDHQKYFAIEDGSGKLLPHFLAVLNTASDSQGMIRHGNERVLRARFNDARFFWQTDQKETLRHRVEMLKNVTFQKDLGSYYEKTIRRAASGQLALRDHQAGGDGRSRRASYKGRTARQGRPHHRTGEGVHRTPGNRRRSVRARAGSGRRVEARSAGRSSQSNLRSLQARVDGRQRPAYVEGAVLSIADKADSIAGMFALGLVPSGSKDPFALRRQANGIVKTIAEHKLPFRLSELMNDARARYKGFAAEKKFSSPDYAGAVRVFFHERLEFYLKESHGYAYDVIKAVLAADSDDVVDAAARAETLSKVRGSADFDSISVAFKRSKNILRQADENKRTIANRVEIAALREESEKTLAALLPKASAEVEKLRSTRDYYPALLEIAKLRPAVDAFFDNVMVMVDDEDLRANRLALLQTLVKEFSTIADFSEIVTEGKESTK